MRQDFVLFKRNDSSSWYFYYWQGDKRNHKSTGKKLKGEAYAFAKQYVKEFYLSKSMTFGEYATGFFDWNTSPWIQRQHAKGRPFSRGVAESRQGHIDSYLLPAFGDKLIDSLDAVTIEDWLLSLPLSNQTRNHVLYSLKIILREAKRAGIIRTVPELESMGNDARATDIFTLEELSSLFPPDLEGMINVWRHLKNAAAFLTMASTGIRAGEMRALLWRDYFKGALHICKAAKYKNEIGDTKAGYDRVVLAPGRTAKMLDRWRSETPTPADDDLIFFGDFPGRVWCRRSANRILETALMRAGIDPAGRQLSPRCFRHTFNTIMRQRLSPELLRALIGHRSEKMTLHYDHAPAQLLLERVETARDAIEEVW